MLRYQPTFTMTPTAAMPKADWCVGMGAAQHQSTETLISSSTSRNPGLANLVEDT